MKKVYALTFLILLILFSGFVYASNQEASTSGTGAVCGNGAVESGEQCDAGGSNGACPAVCSAFCTINSCGGGGGSISIYNTITTPSSTPPPTTTTKTADFNSDEQVDILDLSILLYYIEHSSLNIGRFDLNKDGKIDIFDISIIFYHWNVKV